MINPNGSNIPYARELIAGVLARGQLDPDDEFLLQDALDHMKRQSPLKVASIRQRIRITAKVRDRIKALVRMYPDATNAEIAVAAGLPSCGSGRVSEVMQGLHDHKIDGEDDDTGGQGQGEGEQGAA